MFLRSGKVNVVEYWWNIGVLMKQSLSVTIKIYGRENEWLGKVAQGNARKIKNGIMCKTNPNTYFGIW